MECLIKGLCFWKSKRKKMWFSVVFFQKLNIECLGSFYAFCSSGLRLCCQPCSNCTRLILFKSQDFQQSTWLSSKALFSLRFTTLCFQKKVEDVQHNKRVHRTLPKDQTQLLSLQHDHKQKKKEPSKSSNSAAHPPPSNAGKEVPTQPMWHFGAVEVYDAVVVLK